MMKKILYIASTYNHLSTFHKPYINALKEKGFTIDTLSNGKDSTYDIHFQKSIYSIKNWLLVFKIRRIIKKNKYSTLVLNTALASFFSRIAIIGLKYKPEIINVVHGYLFSDKSNKLKRFILLTCEKMVKKYTDVVITMNRYDHEIATKYKLGKKVECIKGLGVPPLVEENAEIVKEKEQYILYAAEFNKRKNHKFLIDLNPDILRKNNLRFLLIGSGKLQKKYIRYVKKHNLQEFFFFPGYINNPFNYFKNCMIYISPSSSEGLPYNVINAMQFGKTVVASNIKGHQDIINNENNGYLYDTEDDFLKYLSLGLEKIDRFKERALDTYKEFSAAMQFESNLDLILKYLK